MIAASVLVVAVVTTTQAGYVAPVASGYIYRNDNHGPASLIQLGPVPYPQPQGFSPPLPVQHPLSQPIQLQALEAYDLTGAPVPLPYVAAKPIVVEDANDDDDDEDSDESSDEYLDAGDLVEDHENLGHGHGHAYVKEAGSDYGEKHHAAHGESGSKGYNSKDHHEKGESGHYGKEHHGSHYNDNAKEEESHHNEADAHGKHHQSGKKYEGGNHGHKKHFSKGEDVTGYHKVFHKDEFKKDHDFYDVADNSGHFKKFKNGHESHGSKEGGHKENGHHDSAYDKGGFGKAGFHAKGKIDESEEGHSAEEGHDSHYNHEEDFGKKGGSEQEKEFVYEDEDEED